MELHYSSDAIRWYIYVRTERVNCYDGTERTISFPFPHARFCEELTSYTPVQTCVTVLRPSSTMAHLYIIKVQCHGPSTTPNTHLVLSRTCWLCLQTFMYVATRAVAKWQLLGVICTRIVEAAQRRRNRILR